MRAFACGPRGMGKQLGSEVEAWDENEGCKGRCPARVAAVDMESCCVQVGTGSRGSGTKNVTPELGLEWLRRAHRLRGRGGGSACNEKG